MVTLWRHQQRIVDLARSRRCLLVGADMGTGKTLAAIIASLEEWFVIVVAPVAVGPAWAKQYSMWDADRRVFCAWDGTCEKRMTAVRQAVGAVGEKRVLITNYDWFWREAPQKTLLMASASAATSPHALIADESHRIKGAGSKASKALHRLACRNRSAMRLALTGTPMPLGPQDIYGQARFVDESVFGTSHRSFLSQFFVTDPIYPSRIVGTRRAEEFAKRLDSIMFRVKADDVLDLPEAMHERIDVQLPKAVQATYSQVEAALAVEVAGGTVNCANGIVRLLRLQQATSSYLGTDAGERDLEPVAAKAAAIEEWLADLDPAEPVAVFCRFTHDLDQLKALAARAGRRYAELSGREKTLAEWQRGERDFLAVQIQAGGVGVDLTRCGDRACRYVVYMSIGFSLGDYEQSLARVRRPGQTSSTVHYYHCVARGTVDETIYGALRKKRDLVESVLARLSGSTQEVEA